MTKSYMVGYKDRNVNVFDQDGKLIRRFKAKAKVVNAQITGPHQNPNIAVSTEDGKVAIYSTSGMIIRQST